MILHGLEKILLDNTVIAIWRAKAVKKYKQELIAAQDKNETPPKIVTKMTALIEWLKKKLKAQSLGLSDKKTINC